MFVSVFRHFGTRDIFTMNEQPSKISSSTPPGNAWLTGIGVVSILLASVALIFPMWTSLGLEMLFGGLLLIVGALELVRLAVERPRRGITLGIVFGVMAIIAGLLLLLYPLQGMITLTIVIAMFFLFGGAFKVAAALSHKPAKGWGWLLTSGVLSTVLGIFVLVALPGSAFWLLGIFFGVDLLFFGIAQLSFASARRKLHRTGAT